MDRRSNRAVPERGAAARRRAGARLAAALVVLLLIAAACDDDNDGNDDDEALVSIPDACELLDDEEVVEVVGSDTTRAASEGLAVDMLEYTECIWEAPDEALVGIALIEGPDRYDQALELYEEDFWVDPELVDDLGDGAIVATSISLETTGASGGRTARILDGDLSLSIALRLPDETPADDVIELSRTILERVDTSL